MPAGRSTSIYGASQARQPEASYNLLVFVVVRVASSECWIFEQIARSEVMSEAILGRLQVIPVYPLRRASAS